MKTSHAAIALGLSCALAPIGMAHTITPNPVIIRGVNGSATVTVEDCCGCSAVISAESGQPEIFSVIPAQGSGTKVEFTVTPQRLGEGILRIGIVGIGTNPEGDECDEISSNPIEVKIVEEPKSDTNKIASAKTRDPINTFSGEFLLQESPDLALGGMVPIEFIRRYSSRYMAEGMRECGLGQNWTHNYNWQIYDNEHETQVVTWDGRVLRFLPAGGSAWTLAEPTDVAFQLEGQHDAFVLYDPRTHFTYEFGFRGWLTSIDNGKGGSIILAHDFLSNQLTQAFDFSGRSLNFSYDPGGMLVGVSGGGEAVSFGYTGDLLTTFTDARGKLSTYAYDTSVAFYGGLMTAKTLPEGNTPYTQVYDDEGRVSSQTDAYDNTFTLSYSDTGTTVTGPDGKTFTHGYHPSGALTSYTDETEASGAIGYDAQGRRDSVTGRAGATHSMSHHASSGEPVQLQFPDGTTATLQYTERSSGSLVFHDLTSITFPDGSIETRQYDSSGRLLQVQTQTGGIILYDNTSLGLVNTITTPTGGIYDFDYDGSLRLSTLENPAGNLIFYSYDAANRMIMKVEGADTTQYTYDGGGYLLTRVDPNNQEWGYTYDDNGNLLTAEDPLGNVTTYGYDLMDRLISVTDALGHTASQNYDSYGRIAETTNRAGSTLAMHYDDRGFVESITGPESFAMGYAHDGEGLLLSETDALGHTKTFARNAVGAITGITSPRGAHTQIEYDSLARPSKITDPLGHYMAMEFRSDSRPLRVAQPLDGGQESAVNYTWDSSGNLLNIEDPNGEDWSNEYDSSGRLVLERDPLGAETSFNYDSRNRISTVTFPDSMGTLQRTYTPAGDLQQQAFSDGLTLNYTHDNARRLTAANGVALEWNARGDMSACNGLTMTYTDGALIETITYSPGKTVTYGYDARDRLSTVTDWMGLAVSFEYDAAGRCTTINRANSTTTFKTYDADNNVTQISDIMGAVQLIRHDITRDMKAQVVHAARMDALEPVTPEGQSSRTYNAASGDNAATHDGLGRVTTLGTDLYSWDLAGRMTTLTRDATLVAFTYDAFGHLLTRTETGDARGYLWNYALLRPCLSVEINSAGSQYYVYTPSGHLLYRINPDSGERLFYHFDEGGNTALVTDEQIPAGIVARYAYTPFGALAASEGTLDSPFTWQGEIGHYTDRGGDLYLMRARWYNAGAGRFLSRDPVPRIILPAETNPYAYARQNPINFVDPMGTRAQVIATGIHTDIAVDIWEGDQVIGQLKMGFYPKVWKSGASTWQEIKAGFAAVFTTGAKAKFKVNASYGGGLGVANDSDHVTLEHGKEADDRLAREMLKGLGYDPGDGTVSEAFRKLMKEKSNAAKQVNTYLDASAYGNYQVFTQVCNDFTDDMLDKYYGYNWYFGPMWFGSSWTGLDKGLIDEVRQHEQYLKDPTSNPQHLDNYEYAPLLMH